MLVESGKTGCAFEIKMTDNLDEYVVLDSADVDSQRMVAFPRGLPSRLQTAQSKHEPTLFEFVEKLKEAERRRAAQTNRIKAKATAVTLRFKEVLRSNQEQQMSVYWALDAKLREADRRREELVQAIRDRAQQENAKVDSAKTTLVQRASTLDTTISDALVRAEANRVSRLRDLQMRLREHDARAARIRDARDSYASNKTAGAFWSLDEKLQQAERRRRRTVELRRTKAASPTERIARIREQTSDDATRKEATIADKLATAEERRSAEVEGRKRRATRVTTKVANANAELVRRASDLDIAHSTRIMRAMEQRERHLHGVRNKQKERGLKVVRAQQTKRTMAAEC